MLKRLIPAAIVAGVVAGAFALVVQSLGVIPLIHLAEYLESGRALEDYVAPGVIALAFDDPQKLLGTLGFNAIGGIGFSLMTGAVILLYLHGSEGRTVNWKQGLLWGLGGWAIFSLAPSISQPPSVPGTQYVDLQSRQMWWWLCVSLSAVGLSALVFGRSKWFKVIGVVLLVLPHAIGAPGEPDDVLALPGTVARDFALASIASFGAFWLALGAALGHLLKTPQK